jgi:hypothetical protein
VHFVTLTCGWFGALNDFIEFGDATCVNIGVRSHCHYIYVYNSVTNFFQVYLVLWKMICFRKLSEKIKNLVFATCKKYIQQNQKSNEIREMQRYYYLQDVLIYVSSSILGVLLTLALCINVNMQRFKNKKVPILETT